MRWSFGDGDEFYTRWMPALRWCFTRPFVIASLLLFATYVWILASQWQAFGAAVASTFAPTALTSGWTVNATVEPLTTAGRAVPALASSSIVAVTLAVPAVVEVSVTASWPLASVIDRKSVV